MRSSLHAVTWNRPKMTKKISDFITNNVRTVAVVGHLRPDGDCIGSVTAVYRYLTELYPELKVTPYLQPVQDELLFLEDGVPIDETDGDDTAFDLCISVDASEAYRIGAGKKAFENAKYTVAIDHHLSNPGFAEYNVIEPQASSSCEVLCSMMEMDKVSYQTAVSLYTGIIHDSGVFRFSCTGENTLKCASMLIAKGIPFTKIIEESFVIQRRELMLFTADVVTHACLFEEDRVLIGAASLEMQEEYGLSVMDIGGVVATLNKTKEADISVFFYELAEGEWKGSLRTRSDVNVALIAKRFHGGGHEKAAGFDWTGDLQEGIDAILRVIREVRSK